MVIEIRGNLVLVHHRTCRHHLLYIYDIYIVVSKQTLNEVEIVTSI